MNGTRREWALGVALGLVALSVPRPADGILLTITSGAYTQTITSADLAGGAGTDLVATASSGASVSQLSVNLALLANDAWRIDIRRIDGSWDSRLTLSARRTSDGASCGLFFSPTPPSGGLAFQPVTTTDVEIFRGTGNKCGIGVQYQIGGLSLAVPPGTYSTTVNYTLVDI